MRGLGLVVVVLLVTPAHADPASDALKLFEEGKALRDQGKWAEACAKFSESNNLKRRPGTQLNLGECAEREQQLRRAWLLYDDAVREYERARGEAEARLAASPADEEARREAARATAGAKLARERADALSPRLATVTLKLAEPRLDGLSVRIGDRAVPPAVAITELLDAGSIAITASAPGRETFTTTVKAEAGRQLVVEIPVLGVARTGGGGGSAGTRKKSRVRLAIGLGAGGGVLLVGSGVIGLGARGDNNELKRKCQAENPGSTLVCSPMDAAAINDAGKRMDLATYLGVAGLVAVAGGAVIYFTAPREGMTIAPTASPTGAGVSISGRF